MIMLVLDSNTISYYFRGDPQVVPRLQALKPSEIGVPAIVVYELRYGLMRLPSPAATPRLAALETLLAPVQVLPFDRPCADIAARIRAELEAVGTPHRAARFDDCCNRSATSCAAGHAQCV